MAYQNPNAGSSTGVAEPPTGVNALGNGSSQTQTARIKVRRRKPGHHIIIIDPGQTVRGMIKVIRARKRLNTHESRPPEMLNFDELYKKLWIAISSNGTAATPMPNDLAQAVKDGSFLLPKTYIDTYATPLENVLERLPQALSKGRLDGDLLDKLAAPVYQHVDPFGKPAELSRLLAVISNLYRSFLTDEKRARIDIAPSVCIPPLAMFQNQRDEGPFTITAEEVKELIGAELSLVSLPATFAKHPILWGALAHEVGGHDISHATRGLLEELRKGLPAALAGIPPSPHIFPEELCQLWSYWLDEATADVYGILNMGPAFVLNQAVFFAAYLADSQSALPILRTKSGFDPGDPSEALDPHPTDILRLHLAIGVIEALYGLAAEHRSVYNHLIETISKPLAANETMIEIVGNIPVERDHMLQMKLEVPLFEMKRAARLVGRYIATAKLVALGGHGIQDIETWDDSDEQRSMEVATTLLDNKPRNIGSLGDDAQILAGATIALLVNPTLYDRVTKALNDGLDVSFERDPIWGKRKPNRVIIRYNRQPAQPPLPVQAAQPDLSPEHELAHV